MKTGFIPLLNDIHIELRTRPKRAVLTMAAVGMGIAVLTVLLAALSGLEQRAEAAVRSLGTNVIGILAPAAQEASALSLAKRHAALLAANLPAAQVASLRRYSAPTLTSRQPLTVLETEPELLAVRQWQLIDGRFFDQHDLEHYQRHAVIGRTLAQRWGWQVGHVMLLGNLAFTIIGIIDNGSAGLATDTADPALALGEFAVLVPKTTAPRWRTGGSLPDTRLDAIFVHLPAVQDIAPALVTAQELLAQPDQRAGELAWVTPEIGRAHV